MVFGLDIYFNADHADSIVEHCCEKKGMNDMEAWLHCLAVSASLCPSLEMTIETVMQIYAKADEAKKEFGERGGTEH
tara:strand:- start:594 stop:824 length:231 start_codon:yes stop_codon:yes gene_type:complete